MILPTFFFKSKNKIENKSFIFCCFFQHQLFATKIFLTKPIFFKVRGIRTKKVPEMLYLMPHSFAKKCSRAKKAAKMFRTAFTEKIEIVPEK